MDCAGLSSSGPLGLWFNPVPGDPWGHFVLGQSQLSTRTNRKGSRVGIRNPSAVPHIPRSSNIRLSSRPSLFNDDDVVLQKAFRNAPRCRRGQCREAGGNLRRGQVLRHGPQRRRLRPREHHDGRVLRYQGRLVRPKSRLFQR